MRNKLKKVVGTLLTFALAFTMIGGNTKAVNAATEDTHGWKWNDRDQEAGQWTTGAIGGYFREDEVYLKISVTDFLESDETLSFKLSKVNGYEAVNEVIISTDGNQEPRDFIGTLPGYTLPGGTGVGFSLDRNESLSTADEHVYTITYIDKAQLAKLKNFTIYIKASLAPAKGKYNSSEIQFGLVDRGTKTIPFSGNGIIAKGMITITKILKDYMGMVKTDADSFKVTLTGPSHPEGLALDLLNGTDLVVDDLELGKYIVAEIVDSNKYETVISNTEVNLSKNNDEATVTITNTEKTRTITAKKEWVGGAERKPNVTLVLFRNGVPVDEEKELVYPVVEATWKDLEARNSLGELYEYTVDEKEDLEYYSKSVEGFTVTNTYVNKLIDISGEKTWVGEGEKPESIVVRLLRSGLEVDRQEVEEVEGTWKYVFENVPEKNSQGVDYIYTVEEVEIPGFIPTYDNNNITNTTITADVVVTKLGEDEEVLSGAEFTLYKDGVKVGESKVTGLDGKATFEEIPYGTYTVKETKAPTGYVLSEEAKVVDIEDVDDVTVSFSNVKIKGTVQITKVDAENHEITLKGAEFKIEDNNSPAFFDGTTDEDGMLEIELPFGEYTLSEVTAPAGYVKASGTWTISITENDQIVEREIENEKIEDEEVDPEPVEDKVGTFRLTKVDKDDHEILLKGAKFKLVDKDGETVFEGITDEDGKLETELLVGKYTLSEVTAPKDYEKTTKTWTVNIKEDETFALVIENEMIEVEEVDPLPIDDEVGTVRIKKVDKETDAVLAGVRFRITDKDGDVVFEGLTDAEGMIEEELLVGEYTITEVEALPGYVPSTKSEVVRIEEDGEVVNLTITNKKMYGLVSIKKVDAESGEVLEGAKFKIVDKAGVVILEDYTDEDGMLEVWLPKGEYIISETEAPEDYDKTDETWSVKVTADGQLFELEVENTMIEVEVVSPVTLPQTGGIPSEFLYILGAFAIFTGMLLTKKRQGV